MKEFFERVMIATSKVDHDLDIQFKRTWFLNGCRIKLAKYVAYLPSANMATTKHQPIK